jgi:outer membrane biosynthesis protein TonB
MMLRERCWVAGALGLGLLAISGISPGQAPAHKPKVVQPDDGAPPEQAVQPDQAKPLEQVMPADPGLPPEEEKPEEQEEVKPPAPAPVPEQTAGPESPPDPAPEPAPAESKPAVAETPFVAATPQQAALQKEAVHLLQLTEELKAEVDKAGSNMLSLAALRKADEVQKLSRDLKERMKDWGQVPVSKP